MKIRNCEIFEVNAQLCQVMANAKRLMIIDLLGRREMNVGEIAEILEISPATVSQHLRLLRDHQLVKTRKEGQTVFYRLSIPKITKACHMVREVLLDNLKERGAIADDTDLTNLIEED